MVRRRALARHVCRKTAQDLWTPGCVPVRSLPVLVLHSLLLLGLNADLTSAKTIVVSPGPSTIQAAMGQAVSGDTVLVGPGTYVLDRSISVPGGVTLKSSDGPLSTILDAQYFFRVPSVINIINASPPPIVEGLTIARGWEMARQWGGGIHVSQSSPIINNNLIVDNVNATFEGLGGVGCAIGIFGGSPIVVNNTIVSNHCSAGAIALLSTSATVERNVIAFTSWPDSPSDQGFGVFCEDSPSARVVDNILWMNLPADIDTSCASVEGITNNIVLDPQFCAPVTVGGQGLLGDWRVGLSSPLAPGGPYEGWGATVGICDGTQAIQTTWGRIKATYR